MILETLDDSVDPPNTYQKGRTPITTILYINGIYICRAGYLPFGEGVGDHRVLFVDMMIAYTLGVNLHIKCFKTKNPRSTLH